MEAFVLKVVSITQSDKSHQRTARYSVSELFWSIVDVQLAFGHVLLTRDGSSLRRGVHTASLNTISIPKLDSADALFSFYVSIAWEHFYRVWSRLENLLNLALFGLSGPQPQGVPSHLGPILQRVGQTRPALSQQPEYSALQALVKERDRIAQLRNTASHKESSPQEALLAHRLEVSKILQPSGAPYYRVCIDYQREQGV